MFNNIPGQGITTLKGRSAKLSIQLQSHIFSRKQNFRPLGKFHRLSLKSLSQKLRQTCRPILGFDYTIVDVEKDGMQMFVVNNTA